MANNHLSDGGTNATYPGVDCALASNESVSSADAALLSTLRPEVTLTQRLCDACMIDPETVRAIDDVFDEVLRLSEAVGRGEGGQRSMVALRNAP